MRYLATEPDQWILQQMVKEETWEAFVANTLLYAKVVKTIIF